MTTVSERSVSRRPGDVPTERRAVSRSRLIRSAAAPVASALVILAVALAVALLVHRDADPGPPLGAVLDGPDRRVLDAITIGFLLIEQYLPDDFKYSDEEIVEMVTEVVERVFAPSPSSAPPPDEKTKQEISNTVISSLDDILAIRNRIDQEEDTP